MIRRYRSGDHLAIAGICRNAIHRLAAKDYTASQLEAWCGTKTDEEAWRRRCELKQPFVKELNGRVAGFIELDPDGHIDCTYVDPDFARRGVMSEIMEAVKDEARALGLTRLFAEVSITARPFFEKHGFHHVQDNEVHIEGETLVNFIMECPIG